MERLPLCTSHLLWRRATLPDDTRRLRRAAHQRRLRRATAPRRRRPPNRRPRQPWQPQRPKAAAAAPSRQQAACALAPPTPLQWLRTHWVAVSALALAAVTFFVAIAGLAMSAHHEINGARSKFTEPQDTNAASRAMYRVPADADWTTQQNTILGNLNRRGGALAIWMKELIANVDINSINNLGLRAALFNQHALGTWCADGKSCASPSLTAMPENLQALLASGCAAGAWVQYARDGTEYAYKKDKGWYVNGKATNMTAAAAGRGPCSDIPDTLSTLSSFA